MESCGCTMRSMEESRRRLQRKSRRELKDCWALLESLRSLEGLSPVRDEIFIAPVVLSKESPFTGERIFRSSGARNHFVRRIYKHFAAKRLASLVSAFSARNTNQIKGGP